MKLQPETRHRLYLGLILLLGLALRLYHLGWFSIRRDEAFTCFFSRWPLAYLWTNGMRAETNPPGYFSFMHVWMAFFGDGEWALRLPSAIASFGGIVLVYALGRELLSQPVALIGALIMALVPTELWWAQDARAYAFLQLFVGASLFCLACFLGRPQSPAWLVGYAVGAAGAIYCHDTALVYVAACNAVMLALAWGRWALITPRQWAAWLAANLAVGAAAFPLLLAMEHQVHSPNIAWIKHPGISYCCQCLHDLIGGTAALRESLNPRSILVVSIASLAMGAALWNAPRLDRRSAAVLLAVPICFLLLAVGVSFQRPIFIARIFIWTWIPLSLLVAHVLLCRGWRRLPLLFVMGWLMARGLTVQLYPRYDLKENWRAFAQANRDELARSQLIVLVPQTTFGPLIYYDPEILSRLHHWSLYPMDRVSQSKRNEIEEFKIPPVSTDELVAAIQRGERVSLALSATDLAHFKELLKLVPPPSRDFENHLERNYRYDLLSWGD